MKSEATGKVEAAAPDHPALKLLRAQLWFVEAANAHPDVAALRPRLDVNPADLEARHAFAAHHALAGDYATALSEWLELMRRDRKYGDDLARRSLLMAFEALGEGHELVVATLAAGWRAFCIEPGGCGIRAHTVLPGPGRRRISRANRGRGESRGCSR